MKLAGEVDVYTAPMLRDAIIPLTVGKNSNVIVDMTDVGYIDSTGLGVFIGAYKSSYQHNNYLKLIGVTEQIERLFQITGLSEIIDIDTKPRGE